MRILRLDLLKFGPFTDQSLTLDPGQYGLHVIAGPNEAGKSSALRALTQLLYGIPNNSADNFLHPHQDLRIGALLENVAGDRLECVRRKGAKKTLLDSGGIDAIDDQRLTAMLGGVDDASFRQRFGIDYAELRRGGKSVVQGGDDLGKMLFAAASGIANLGRVQKRLAEEADELFKARGQQQKINKAVSDLNDARRAIKEAQLPSAEWEKHDKALRTAEQRQSEIDLQLTKKRTEQHRLERISKSLPLIGRCKRLQEQLIEVADAPLLPDSFSGDRREAVTELTSARQAEAEASEAIKKIQEDIDKLNIPKDLLEHRTAISRLHTELGSYQKACEDRPKLKTAREGAEQQARKILEDLGREPQLDQAEQLRLSRVQRQRIQSLAAECKARFDRKQSADKAYADLCKEIERLESELAALPVRQDVGELNRAIRRVQKHGDLDQQLVEARATLRQLEKQAEVDLKTLRLFSGPLLELEQLPVPALETVDRFDKGLGDAETAVNRINERIDELNEKARQILKSVNELQLVQDVPTEEDLAQTRRQRETGWQLVRQTWLDGLPADDPAVLKFIEEFANAGELAQAFQASVEAVDAIADRLRREADRVAQKANLTAEHQDLDQQLTEQKKKLVAATETLEQIQSQWCDQWTDAGIEPLSPREMRSWLNEQKKLAEAASAIREQRDAIDDTAKLVQSLREELSECLERLAERAGEDSTLSETLERCDSVASRIESANRQREEFEKNRTALREKASGAKQEAEQAQVALEQWRTDWATAVAAIGLERDAEPSEANTVIEAVDEMFGQIKQADSFRDRIEGIDQDAGEFEQSVQRLLEQVADDLLKRPVDQAVADLYDRLEAAGTAQTKLDGWQEQLQAEVAKRSKARANIERLSATIKSMCQQANCASADDLPAAEERSKQRRDLEIALKAVTEQLDELAGGTPREEWIADAQQFDPDQLPADVQHLENEISELEREKKEVDEAIWSHRDELRRMDGSARAAEAQEQAEHLLARVRGDAEQYVRLRLASAVLQRSVERFREKNQGPVLGRASELFSELTLSSFAGLRADYNDKGEPVLVGVRAGGQSVGIEGMSDGACDQLYLALRLASLETYLAQREPLPFIVDDILIMFDDDRAVAALKTLARLSEQTQVLFFTHHEHLVELASQNLDHDTLFTHRLDHRKSTATAPTP